MAQSVKQLTLDFGSGHDLMVGEFQPHEFKPRIRLCTEPAWDSLSLLPLSLPLPPAVHALSQNKLYFFNVYLFLRERDRDRARVEKGQRERERERERDTKSKAGSSLSAVSSESNEELTLTYYKIMT